MTAGIRNKCLRDPPLGWPSAIQKAIRAGKGSLRPTPTVCEKGGREVGYSHSQNNILRRSIYIVLHPPRRVWDQLSWANICEAFKTCSTILPNPHPAAFCVCLLKQNDALPCRAHKNEYDVERAGRTHNVRERLFRTDARREGANIVGTHITWRAENDHIENERKCAFRWWWCGVVCVCVYGRRWRWGWKCKSSVRTEEERTNRWWRRLNG